jgi:hypothetical protein
MLTPIIEDGPRGPSSSHSLGNAIGIKFSKSWMKQLNHVEGNGVRGVENLATPIPCSSDAKSSNRQSRSPLPRKRIDLSSFPDDDSDTFFDASMGLAHGD